MTINNTCKKCGCGYIQRSSDWKSICRCEESKMYDMLRRAFEEAFEGDEDEEHDL